jgi:hypothetical protein
MTATSRPQPEPLRTTLIRNAVLAIVAGTVLHQWSARWAHPIGWFVAVVAMLWPTLGGHWLELGYLDWLQPRLPAAPTVRRLARIATWFVGGCAFGVAMALTLHALDPTRLRRWPGWGFAGAVFVAVELVVHAALAARGQRSFFNGRG